MQHSPLHDRHVALGAKFSDFGGWTMPLQYSGVVAEHQAVRDAAGLFDVSHLGKVSVTGPGAVDFLNLVLANDLSKIAPGQAQYTLLCNPDGGVVDDLIAYLISPSEVFLVPNAANSAAVVAALAGAAPPGIRVTDRHRDFAVLAVQGPASTEVLESLELPTGLPYMSFELAGDDGAISVCRTGYTGEVGFELIIPADRSAALWDRLMRAGAGLGLLPAGLGARDTLRTEMGYALHGHEITPEIDPVSAGLSWAVGWAKPSFVGSARLRELKASGPQRRARGLRAVGRGIPRPGMAVVDPAGAAIGVLTSGTFSPTLKTGIGLGLIDAGIGLGERVEVMIRGRAEPFEVVSTALREVVGALMGRKLAHVAVIVVGAGLVVWGLLLWVNPTASCRGVQMGPGDVCSYASTTSTTTDRVQTYEERVGGLRSNAPVVIVLGLGLAGFGGALLRRQVGAHSASDIGP